MKDSAPELNVSSSETEEDKEEAKLDGEKDPDFNQVRVESNSEAPGYLSVPSVGYWFSAPALFFLFLSSGDMLYLFSFLMKSNKLHYSRICFSCY